jgi:hypothetical protein
MPNPITLTCPLKTSRSIPLYWLKHLQLPRTIWTNKRTTMLGNTDTQPHCRKHRRLSITTNNNYPPDQVSIRSHQQTWEPKPLSLNSTRRILNSWNITEVQLWLQTHQMKLNTALLKLPLLEEINMCIGVWMEVHNQVVKRDNRVTTIVRLDHPPTKFSLITTMQVRTLSWLDLMLLLVRTIWH